MAFPHAYAWAGNCAPIRACLLSGQYTPRHGVSAVSDTNRGPANLMRLVPVPNRSGLPAAQVTLADALRAAGHATALYAACLFDLDEAVGRLLARLRELGLVRDTLVVFTSDNGGTQKSSQEPLRGNQGCYYEGGILVSGMTRQPYSTDLTDDQWDRLEPLIPKLRSGTRRGGRPAADTREVVHALCYLLRSGQASRLLPHDCPPWQSVYTRFRGRRLDGTWEWVHARLREEVRLGAGVPPQPLSRRIDSQMVKTTHRGGDRGWDGGKSRSAASGSRWPTRSD